MTTYYEPSGPKKKGLLSFGGTGREPQPAPTSPAAAQPQAQTFQGGQPQMLGAARNWYEAAAYGPAAHFGQMNDAVNQINQASTAATSQWHDANQQHADREQKMALSNNAMNTALQMKKMEVDRDREKYGVLAGLLGPRRITLGGRR